MPHLFHMLSNTAIALACSVLLGCASTPSSYQYNANKGLQIVSQARALIGIPYQYGGNSLKGLDCSGMTQYAHHRAGINIPRTTRAQINKIKHIKLSRLQPGDLIFFRLSGRKVSHVGIYIGNNKMIHAPSSGKRVSYASLDSSGYWRSRIIATGRFY